MKIKDTLTGATGGDAEVTGDHSTARGGDAGQSRAAPGGRGGNASVKGNNSNAAGGRGGHGGLGQGGPGGDAHVIGDNSGCLGGNGGEANQEDGRGGRGGAAQGMEFLGFCQRRAGMKLPYGEPNNFPGRGGDGPDTLQHMARRLIVEDLKLRFFIKNRLTRKDVHHIWYDREEVPLAWINSRLEAEEHKWRAAIVADEYAFSEITLPGKRWKDNVLAKWFRRLFSS